MKNKKGVTLISLVIYIAVVFVVIAVLMRITTYFSSNIKDAADISFETEFDKLNLYLLDESKKTENKIEEIVDETQITFSSGNKYTYNAENETVYLNYNVKICEGVESCIFEQKTAENGKSVLVLTITINETTKTVEYVMSKETDETTKISIQDYLQGGSLAAYYLKVGDYVDYTPDSGTYTVASGTYGSGYEEEQSFTTEEGDSSLAWRILSIDEETGEIELVSATVGQTLTLYGADGYNHAVDILNDLCETLYSKTVNGTKVATGRSINVEDINAKTTYDYTTYTNGTYTYGDTFEFTTYTQYPNLYKREIGNGVGGTENLIEVSEGVETGTVTNGVTTYTSITGSDSASTLSGKYTHYLYSVESYLDEELGINTAPTGLINLETNYWLASRSAYAYSEYIHFNVRFVSSSGNLANYFMIVNNGDEHAEGFAVRPVVTLSVNLFDFTVGDGSEDSPWGLK